MEWIIGILAFILMLSVIVIVHEAGHLIAAKAFGVYCNEFSIGMGPALWQKKGKETTVSIRAFPIGGYVMMAGEDDGSQDAEEDEWLKNVPEDRKLYSKKWWQQIIIMAAGVFMNFVLALLIFVGLAFSRGYIVDDPLPVVYEVVENTPASRAGLQEGDDIIKAVSKNGESVEPKTQYELAEFTQLNPEEMTLTVLRDGKEVQLSLTPEMDEESNTYIIGYRSKANTRKGNFFEYIKAGWDDMIYTTSSIFSSLGMLLTGKHLDQVSGPVGIFQITKETAMMGIRSYISLFALISVNIGIFNLLPIPALDGGRIVILLLEKIIRRKINPKIVENIILASFVLLFGIMIFATYNDILRLFS